MGDDKTVNALKSELDQWQAARGDYRRALDVGVYEYIIEKQKALDFWIKEFTSHLDLPFLHVDMNAECTGDHELTVTIRIVNDYNNPVEIPED